MPVKITKLCVRIGLWFCFVFTNKDIAHVWETGIKDKTELHGA